MFVLRGKQKNMEEKNRKIMLAVLIIILIVATAVLVVMIMKNKNQSQPQPVPLAEMPQAEELAELEEGTVPLTEEKKEELEATVNTTGKLTMVDIGAVKATTDSGEELTLNISQEKGASFIKQTKQGEDTFLNEEIGLFDLPLNKEVEIQYNNKTNDLMMVIVNE